MTNKIKTIINFLSGFAILLFDLCILLALYSYNEQDPSFNSISTSSNIIYNNLGIFGAYLADFFLQLFGIVSYFIVFALAFIGINIIKITFNNKNNSEKRFKFIYSQYLKIIMFIVYIMASCGLMEKCFNNNVNNANNSGGAVGKYLEKSLNWLDNWLIYSIYTVLILLSLNIIVEFNYKKSYNVLKFILKIFFKFLEYTFLTIVFIIKIILKIVFPNSMVDIIKNKCASIKAFFTQKKYNTRKQREIEIEKIIEDKNKRIEILEKYIKDIQDKSTLSIFKINERLENDKKIIKNINETKIKNFNMSRYKLPPYNLLNQSNEKNNTQIDKIELQEMKEELLDALNCMGIGGEIVKISIGPVITLFEFEADKGIRSSRLVATGTADDVARYLRVPFVRISSIPERNVFGVEVPNKKRNIVFLRNILESPTYKEENLALQIILGVDISGQPVITSLADCPHMLIAGTTGSGKSVAINAIILSLLFRYHYEECKLVLIDPKMVEFNRYNNIPNLLFPVVTEIPKVVMALKWLVAEMDKRYSMMMELQVNNIDDYNEKVQEAINKNKKPNNINIITGYDRNNKPIYKQVEAKKIPYIVVIIDEYAELMTTVRKDTETLIQRLAQKARASGIHLIIATQRPSANVITGVIKLNFPIKISFRVGSKIDSRVVLGESGAEKLLGKGDMLHNIFNGGSLARAHAPFVSNEEIEKVIEFIKKQNIKSDYVDIIGNQNNNSDLPDIIVNGENISGDDENLYQEALNIFRTEKRISGSYLQRRLRIGYNKAANLVERAEREGIIRDVNGKKELVK